MAKQAPLHPPKAQRNPNGRPTDLTQELVDKANDYADNPEKYGDIVPLMSGLAVILNVTRETVNQWSKDFDSGFSDVADKVKANQERALINKGLLKEFDSPITRTMLSKHGYHEKQEIHTIHSHEELSDDELAARIAAFQS